ncbi:hypothetical protein ACH5RR_018875 [Cinchona calisaya]|uniref:Uncharacterized protein n=1 Tax=Cinchona calisaya TaxID=153742 RepID=A0ABD2ZMU8_9GENT
MAGAILDDDKHSKRQLQVLKAVINNVLQELKSGLVNGVDTTCIVPESISDNIKANSGEEKAVYAAFDDFCSPDSAEIREFQKIIRNWTIMESLASLVSYKILPLLDEDWIPPPPPDNKPIRPPPPPDKPPEITYSQSSDLVANQSFSYSEQYNLYPSSHFQ